MLDSNWWTVTIPTPALLARSCWLHESKARAARHCADVIIVGRIAQPDDSYNSIRNLLTGR
jgi:hypothetical protein